MSTLNVEAAAIPSADVRSAARSAVATRAGGRIESIDGLRGLVMVLMLVDHAREFFFYGHQVADPMDLATTSPALFFTRMTAHLCAPVFVALTGLAAWLYGARRTTAETSGFLLRRGAFLIALELTVIGFAWTFTLPPTTVFLQVIWAIGWSMIALAMLVHVPRPAIAMIGAAIVVGHNLLDPVAIAEGQPGHALWAILHDRGYIELWDGARARTSYPVLPWIGMIALGYAIGPWFAAAQPAARRRRYLLGTAVALLIGFVGLRGLNGYGDPTPWIAGDTSLKTIMAFLNVTKYPPSLDFAMLTLGVGALLLAAWDRRSPAWLAVLGGAPLFFYVLHLYALHVLRIAYVALTGPVGDVPSVAWVWLIAVAMLWPLWLATRAFAQVKRRSGRWWVRYL